LKAQIERMQRSASAVVKPGELAEGQMALGARVLEILALKNSTSLDKRMELVHRDFNAPIHIRMCAALKMRPEVLTRTNFVGQPLRLEVCKEKLKPMAGGHSKKTVRSLWVVIYLPPGRERF